ncbi:hypothetical protein [Levilactobacillus yiduensis]|uniref:hypothetical protein n=1 Tax=Levilactobacillus yiduensis TaxID=2953880 RepID=UPI000EF2E64C|nr:hypothetical protein [Levilactobacillus yiduensis]AYM02045.1 hypothetical protein D8911_03195 [Levilactobacillus brevis]
MIRKVLLTTFSAVAVFAAGIGFSGVTASAHALQGAANTQYQQSQASTYTASAVSLRGQAASQTSTTSTSNNATGATITAAQFEQQGVVYLNGNKWTYYSGSLTADGTQISANGLDPNGYRVVAAPASVPFGTKIMTPLGMGVVHDRGTAITGNHYDVVLQ